MKYSVHIFLFKLLFLAVFNTLFFLLTGFQHPVGVWLSYGFIHFSYLLLFFQSVFIEKAKTSNHIFRHTISTVVWGFFVLTLFTSIVLVYIKNMQWRYIFTIHLIETAIFVGVLLTVMLFNIKTAKSEKSSENERYWGCTR